MADSDDRVAIFKSACDAIALADVALHDFNIGDVREWESLLGIALEAVKNDQLVEAANA